MIKEEKGYYYEDGKEDWKTGLTDLVSAIIGASLLWFAIMCLTGCASHKTTEYVYLKDSVSQSKKADTVSFRQTTLAETRFVDRWRERIIILNDKGDTIKEKENGYIHISENKELHDSISEMKKYIEKLEATKKDKEKVYIQKSMTWWEKIKIDTYEYVIIAMLMIIAYIVFGVFYNRKMC